MSLTWDQCTLVGSTSGVDNAKRDIEDKLCILMKICGQLFSPFLDT